MRVHAGLVAIACVVAGAIYGSHTRPGPVVSFLRSALLLPLTWTVALGLCSAEACEKHLRGHSNGSDTAAQAAQK